jgi:hypothetical protein
MLQTVNTYPQASGPTRSARRSSLRYAGVTRGGRPVCGRSDSDRIPPLRHRRRMSLIASGLNPVARAIDPDESPAADSSRHTARLNTRADGAWSRTRRSSRHRHGLSRIRRRFMPKPPAGHTAGTESCSSTVTVHPDSASGRGGG